MAELEVALQEELDEEADDGKCEGENRRNYKCEKCNKQFTLSSNYRRHILHNKICGSSKQEFKCSNCQKQFSLNATLKDHYERCTAEDPYRFNCPNCPKLFTFKSSLNKHLRGRCRYLKKSQNTKMYKCNYCVAEFFSYSAWRKHLSEGICTLENNVQHHVCPHCANRFTLKSSLNKHLKGRCKAVKLKEQEIKMENIVENNVQQYDCPHCANAFTTQSSLNKHLKGRCKEVKHESQDAKNVGFQKYEIEIISPYEVITDEDVINTDDVIEECSEWETFETEDVESYIEIANEDDVEDESDYQFIKTHSLEKF